MSTKISFFLFIILSSSSLSSDTLTVLESLNFNQTLISAEQKYEAGFFTPGPGADPNRIYLGIWYYNHSDAKTVAWVANRDNPATNSSNIVLKLRSDGGGQAVMEDGGVVIWASNKSSNSVVNPVLQLLDTGNLVIKEDDNVDDYIWQSFDYPTDTLLPSQKLGWTKNTGLDRRLISWKSTSDPSSGNYSLTLTRTGDPEMFMKGGPQKIYRTGPFTGQCLSGIPAMISYKGMNFIVVGQDKLLYRYTWVPDSRYWSHPEVLCDKYMACGAYGVCDGRQAIRLYVCARGGLP